MIEVKLFLKMQKMYFLYMFMVSFVMYFFVETKLIWFLTICTDWIHVLLVNGITYGLCKVFAQVLDGQISYFILFRHMGIFLILLPLGFLIRAIWNNDMLQAISTLLLIFLPNIILSCYLYLKRNTSSIL